ncbi:MAG: dihydrofolate reductase family protein [Alphaproteobacteria bacterium]|nr:dihydrofolate reductase family protein [Alphaproteobacteria bacterium]MBU1383262.1 dihydrofolate reductase family protein [Alphaproteobacteria bacterium]MBU2270545.1 dihydrofolate reductase family protein [Alphaproteobacteria bacterium]MBU2419469.1 dihydrofolate reductase family protein [Alphaproteobacteria bacterium]
MRQIRTATFVSLDGVMQAPGGPDEDTSGGFAFGGWVWPFFDEAAGGLMDEAMGRDYDLLLGRRTYEIFAGYWPFMEGELAGTFNAINKYVAAGPETPLTWAHSHRLEGDLAQAVRALKATEGRDLLIQGSSEVIHTLLAHDLIDQLTLLTFPVILGAGKRVFDSGSQHRTWTLTNTRQSGSGVVAHTYDRTELPPRTGSFGEIEPGEAELARRERWAREG